MSELVNWNEKDKLVKVLNEEGVIAFPTDTVYGLGVKMTSFLALEKMKKAKRRPETKPFTVMVSKLSQIEEIAILNERDRKIIAKFFPGALTIILNKKENVSPILTNGYQTIGIRMPDDKNVLELIDKVGCGLLVPSANISGLPPALSHEEVLEQLDGALDLIVRGKSGGKLASTIVDLTKDEIKIIRQGNITLEEIIGGIK